jgi:LemA protein
MIGLVVTVIVVLDVILLGVWLVRVHGEVNRFREEVNCSWIQLREAIVCRREIMPYLIASISLQEREAVEAIGNACDLASQVAGISEQARAESRLNTALQSLLMVISEHVEFSRDPSFQRICMELKALDERIDFLCALYNKQVAAYNTRMESAPARLLSLFVPLKMAESFNTANGGVREALAQLAINDTSNGSAP